MKAFWGILLTAVLLLFCGGALAAPELTDVFASGASLTGGQDGWYFQFTATQGGTLALRLLSAQTDETVCELGVVQIGPGAGRIDWNGTLADGSIAAPGAYVIAVSLEGDDGETCEPAMISVQVLAQEQSGWTAVPVQMSTPEETAEPEQTAAPEETAEPEQTAAPEETAVPEHTIVLDLSGGLPEESIRWEEEPTAQPESEATPEPEPVLTPEPEAEPEIADKNAVPYATSFWDMNPDLYDLSNPAHQKAIWDLMMQPITVLDVGQTEHVYPTNRPGINRTPYKENCTGELHGQSQGVHVLEEDTDGDGYVLIEAYSNDGTKTNSTYMESLNAKLIQGYVKKSLLFQVKPSEKYALLVDKLRQKMFIFEAGEIIGTLDISSGLNNSKQPYNESPAGEFITVSRVGLFVSGTTRADYAIRINGGTLLHEVPYRYGADGKTKIYSGYEEELGYKASHACIRIQRRKNADGQNMAWLWNNLELKTKVFIWDDVGREMYDPELPDPDMQLFRNPNGGSNYHVNAYCTGVKEQFLPLTGDFTYGELEDSAFSSLTPCPYCGAPKKRSELYKRYAAAAKEIGAEISDEAKAQFGL